MPPEQVNPLPTVPTGLTVSALADALRWTEARVLELCAELGFTQVKDRAHRLTAEQEQALRNRIARAMPTSPGPDRPSNTTTRPPDKIRLFNFAKELGLENKTVLAICAELGFVEVKNQLSGLTPDQVQAIRERVQRSPTNTSQPDPKPPSPSAPPPRSLGLPRVQDVKVRTLSAAKPKPPSPAAESASAAAPSPAPPPVIPNPNRMPTLGRPAVQVRNLNPWRPKPPSPKPPSPTPPSPSSEGEVSTPPTPSTQADALPSLPPPASAETKPATPVVGPPPQIPVLLPNRMPNLSGRLPTNLNARRPGSQPSPKPPPPAVPPPPAEVDSADATPSPLAFLVHEITLHYPLPVALSYRRMLTEKDRRVRLSNLFLAAESLVRYLTALAVADLIRGLSATPATSFPSHPAFDFLRRPTNLTFGGWRTVLQTVAKELAADAGRVVRELPDAVAPNGAFDAALSQLNALRNSLSGHPAGSVAVSEAQARAAFGQGHSAYLQAVQAVGFLREYALGFARPQRTTRTGGKGQPYRLHGCMGWRVLVGPNEVAVRELAAGIAADAPFVITPDQSRLLHLWPMLTARDSPQHRQPAVYTFERMDKGGQFVSAVRYAGLDVFDEWEVGWIAPPPADAGWVFRAAREKYPPHPLPTDRRAADHMLRRHRGLCGQTLGGYKLEAVLGQGGSGTVYAGVSDDGRRVAVKVLHEECGEEAIARFVEERSQLEKVAHPGLVRVLESGEEEAGDGRYYYWFGMEFAAGGDLAGRIRGRQPAVGIPWDDAASRAAIVDEFREIAGVVAHLHGHALVHRDVKPANVLVMSDGTLRLSDFGLVKALAPSDETRARVARTVTGVGVGTPEYMAPEQARGEEDVRSPADVYSLGILLAELALGVRPEHKSSVGTGSTLGHSRKLQALPDPLRRFILRCTESDPAARPADAAAVLQEFSQLVLALSAGTP